MHGEQNGATVVQAIADHGLPAGWLRRLAQRNCPAEPAPFPVQPSLKVDDTKHRV